MQGRDLLSPRDHKCGFYLMVGNTIRLATFKEFCIQKHYQLWLSEKVTESAKWKRPFDSQMLVTVSRLRRNWCCLFWKRKQNSGWNQEPSTMIPWPWDLITTCTVLAWLNVRIVLKQCLLFPSFFSLFEDVVCANLTIINWCHFWQVTTCHLKSWRTVLSDCIYRITPKSPFTLNLI